MKMTEEQILAYFHRIGLKKELDFVPNGKNLARLQYAHVTHIPYETADIVKNTPISLEPSDIFDKVVLKKRGGFCFELNGLFCELLQNLGYEVTNYFARFLRGEKDIPMRRHRILKVTATDGEYIADVGVGQAVPKLPMRFNENHIETICGETYCFQKDDFLGWVLSDLKQGEWRKVYSFTEEPQLPVDFVATSFWCEKSQDSPFLRDLMVSIKTFTGRKTIHGNEYKMFDGEKVFVQAIKSKDEMTILLKKEFGLSL